MKTLLSFFFCVIVSISYSQNTIKIDKHSINSGDNLSYLLDLHKQKNENTDEIVGYRIQIASDNDKVKVYNQKAKVYQQYSEFKSYLKYDQPYYKLRIGDFKTRLEARRYLEKIIKHFPSAFIVLDNIKVR